jgi:hypothetical protein
MTTSKGFDNEKNDTYTFRYDEQCPNGNLSVLCKSGDGLALVEQKIAY